jgi:hypothetical protein
MAKEQDVPGSESSSEGEALLRKSLLTILVVIGAGLLAILLFSLQGGEWRRVLAINAFGISMAGASLLTGGLTGLLFGIPRRLQTEQSAPKSKDKETGGKSDDDEPAAGQNIYASNTNLEQISDWLTKILVGVGLTQLDGIGRLLSSLGDMAAPALANLPASKATAIAIVIFFVVSGFLFGYLWTRLYLGRWLTEAENASSLKKKLTGIAQQANADAKAIELVSRQLEGDDSDVPAQSELDRAIREASKAARSHAFYRAQAQRERNWRDAFGKPKMERTIPVFQALAASDRENAYHRNYAQLGYAHKDKAKPDWQAAEAALTRAISLRGDARFSNWRGYEFNRAICRIHLDDAFNAGHPTPKDRQAPIISDLRTGIADEWVLQWALEEPSIDRWLKLNKLTLDGIAAD